MEDISQLTFNLVGYNGILSQSRSDSVDSTIVLIDGKLVLANDVVKPVMTLVMPSTPAKLGELVVVEAKLTGEYKQYIKNAKVVWNVSENGNPKQCWTQGRNVVFGTGVSDTSINVSAKLTISYQIDNQIVQKVVTTSGFVQVGDPGPNLPSPPSPTNAVQTMVADWAKDPSIVPVDGTRKTVAQALSKNFKSLSVKIGSEGFTDLKVILTQTKNSNNDAIIASGVDPKNWDAWGKKLQDYLFTEYTAKRLVSATQAKKLWWDIATGLWTVN